jgi:hypothetical protein
MIPTQSRNLVRGLSLTGVLALAAFARPAADSTNSIGMKIVRVEPGSFRMGDPRDRTAWNEAPAHEVTISQPLLVSETEVTVEQFRRFRPGFDGTPAYRPYAAGVSWDDATAFAEWLSRKEGRPYRLPTEAEWEYVARAGSDDAKAQARERLDEPNAWGVRNMLAGPREWCRDWFGEYAPGRQTDPVGPESGNVKVVRGGGLDREERYRDPTDFGRPQTRLAMPPSFGAGPGSPPRTADPTAGNPEGLIGVWYRTTEFSDPQAVDRLSRLHNSWSNDVRGGGRWSARWRGFLDSRVSAEVTFTAEGDPGFTLELDGRRLLDTGSTPPALSATVSLAQGRKYPVVATFVRDRGNAFRVYWQWAGQARELVPAALLMHGPADESWARGAVRTEDRPGLHAIGFRLVQGEPPATAPLPTEVPYLRQGVKQSVESSSIGPDPKQPYFRKRYMLPTPLENSPDEAIDAAGMHPSFRGHNHSPGLAVLPNGDVLLVIYTSHHEYEQGVSLIASRLRFGAEEWDLPSRFLDFVGVNDHAPLVWNDRGTVRVFWGNPQLGQGGFPFQWTASRDNGATWNPIRFPSFSGRIGSHSRQPINTAFRDSQGRMHVSSDGSGGESLLWASDDDGGTWFDTGGRSAGRHTSFAALAGGRILALGGKNTHIDEFMPKAVSRDRGRSYEVTKSPFPRLGTNQRPTLIRLASGRLLFAGDFVQQNDGSQPRAVNQLGCYVALSSDEGETWHVKKLIGAQLHEEARRAEIMRGPTLGYAVARQGPNGLIHLITTMNNPCLHFELNEAWILDGAAGERSDAELMASHARELTMPRAHEEHYPDGKVRIRSHGGVADDGRFLLDGTETWFYPDGRKQREAIYHLGRKTGIESYWSRSGALVWSWEYGAEAATWRQYGPEGRLRAESVWRNFKAHGPARLWDPSGKLVGERRFADGKLVP